MRVTLPDATTDAILGDTPADAYALGELQAEIARRLDLLSAAGVRKDEPFLVLRPQTLIEISAQLGRHTTPRNVEELKLFIGRLAAISFHHVRLDFTLGQLAELQMKADREQMAVAEYTGRIVRAILQQFFTTPLSRGGPNVVEELQPMTAATGPGIDRPHFLTGLSIAGLPPSPTQSDAAPADTLELDA